VSQSRRPGVAGNLFSEWLARTAKQMKERLHRDEGKDNCFCLHSLDLPGTD
jgi:hypothetical protein